MQQIDFTEGGYINPAFTDTLDAYSDTITGYAPSRLGQPVGPRPPRSTKAPTRSSAWSWPASS